MPVRKVKVLLTWVCSQLKASRLSLMSGVRFVKAYVTSVNRQSQQLRAQSRFSTSLLAFIWKVLEDRALHGQLVEVRV